MNIIKRITDKLRRKPLLVKPVVIESAFCEVFDKAAHIHHWHDTLYNKETGECEGMVVSASHVRELWKVLSKYRDFRHSL